MSLFQHVLRLHGAGGTLTEAEMLTRLPAGTKITRVLLQGCMATDRQVMYTGTVIGPQAQGKYPGVLVDYNGARMWEPLDNIFFVGEDQAAEVWV